MNDRNLDSLASAVTAYPSFEALVTACRGGYVPSLYPFAGRARWIKSENALRADLADVLTRAGCKVWLGR